MDKIKELQNMINNSKNIVFFGGEGVSTESGIKDFRSKDGLYHMKYKYPPEMILSHTFFENNPKEFYIFYKDKMNCMDAKPNIMHTEAGNKNVFELHGNVMRNYCTKCHKFYDGEFVFKSKDLPLCSCGGLIKPDVVLYEEPLDEKTINGAIDAINKADVLIVAGTSLTVYPASSFVSYYRGNKMVIINRDPTDYDRVANLVINDSLKDV